MFRSILFRVVVLLALCAMLPFDAAVIAAPPAAAQPAAAAGDHAETGVLERIGDFLSNLWSAGGGGFDPLGLRAVGRTPAAPAVADGREAGVRPESADRSSRSSLRR